MKVKSRHALLYTAHATLLVMFLTVVVVLAFFSFPPGAEAQTIMNTKHNLSVSGPGMLKALTETRVCIFCHTPHNAAPRTPLWNKALEPINYILYSSSTLAAKPSQPLGPSKLCLSCHDGTIALGAVLSPAGGIATTGQIMPGRPSYLGTNLTGDHPFSFSYYDSTASPYAGLSPVPPQNLIFYGPGNIECSTCHDAHSDAYTSPDTHGVLTGKFLAMDNRYSSLCTTCHSSINGWPVSSHRTAIGLRPVTGVLPVPPREWPTWLSVAEWGCEGCHTVHSAGGQQRLLYYQEEEKNCYFCHDGAVATRNIRTEFLKLSKHPIEATTGAHDPLESPRMITNRHVECVDCHNPHAANGRTASPPSITGRLEQVSGVDISGAPLMPPGNPAIREYEVCFKCHADWAPQFPFIPRVISTTNTRLQFDQMNPSYHPIAGIGKNMNIPSFPSPYAPLLNATSIIYCSDCHSDDDGSRGPHGSQYPPILRDRYDTADFTLEGFQTYALCYRCHNRDSILSDTSFTKHRRHIVDVHTPCSVCHDAHGIPDNFATGSHTHLINFDIRTALPAPGNISPLYNGPSRSCTLVCHGKAHDINLKY
jgi:predicted CXXCH cytochrome family protein